MSKVGLNVPCETCGQRTRVIAQDSKGVGKVGYDLECGHRAGWKPEDAHKDFAVGIEYRPKYVHSHVNALYIDRRIGGRILGEVRTAMINASTGRLLFEYDVATPLTEEMAFHLMEDLIGLLPGMRIAFVNADPKQHPATNLAKYVSNDRGEKHSFFTNTGEAQDWLLSDR